MKIKKESSRLVQPIYEGSSSPTANVFMPLSPFDTVTFDAHVGFIYVYKPPNPPNKLIELGLRRVLAEYREWAGRLVHDREGNRCILLNDAGVRFVEASSDHPLGRIDQPSPHYLQLHPPLEGAEELAQVQLTRFSCGSLVLGLTTHHVVADGFSISNFLVSWGKATRSLPIRPLPFRDRSIFLPRNPPKFQFDHCGWEYMKARPSPDVNGGASAMDVTVAPIVVHKAYFPSQFLQQLKAKASAHGAAKPYTTFESLTAHIWRLVTRVRRLCGSETTQIRISVNGRTRMSNPKAPMDYFGNLVLWAFPRSKAADLLNQPLSHAARLIHDAIAGVNNDYFRSFIDYSSSKTKMQGLVPTADMNKKVLCPNLEVDSWLRFPFYDVDFGGGCPYVFTPSYFPEEGMIFIVPSIMGNGDIDAFVPLFQEDVDGFRRICYSLD
ncbi:putrescine hydroxycinnamoyltransferase-like [Nymphaea colorata]|nr:putrescine hydroxycinnamoyltransferase-like [Nymphaea colorata]